MPTPNVPLKKALTSIHLWAIAVGLVISGEYFGWNYGWGVAGTVGFLIATLIVTVLYITFIFSFTELTTSIPHSGGPYEYARRALGPIGGLIAGYATLIEFLFATPAIAFALGSYAHFLYPTFDITYTAIGCYIVFSLINFWGIKESAVFTLIVTLLAVVELLIFIGIVAPHFQLKLFMNNNMPFGFKGIFAALPFAIWFYLAIEGVAMVAEEAKDPQRTIPRGYIFGIATLTFLALGVMIVSGGITDWQLLSAIDYPLPESIGIVLGKENSLTVCRYRFIRFDCFIPQYYIGVFSSNIRFSKRWVFTKGFIKSTYSISNSAFRAIRWWISRHTISLHRQYTAINHSFSLRGDCDVHQQHDKPFYFKKKRTAFGTTF